MEKRKGDATIYVVSFLFLICILAGGVLLGLYIFLPQKHTPSWYPIVGFILVGIPWGFWFLAYLYRCFKPDSDPQLDNGESTHENPPPAVPSDGTTTQANASKIDSSVGERRVHFGSVIVLGNEESGGDGELGDATQFHASSNDIDKPSVGSRESEMPLTLSVSS